MNGKVQNQEKYLTPKNIIWGSHFDTYLNSNEMVAMTDTERKVAELNALIDAVEGEQMKPETLKATGQLLIYDKSDSSKVKCTPTCWKILTR